MKIIFCGGGTAGHVSPAIAIAEEFKRCDEDCKILFIGRDGGPENQAIEKSGFKLRTLKIEGLSRNFSLGNVKKIALAMRATKKAKRIIREFMPDAVIGTGGYVSYPVLKAAKKLNIPTAIHESNASAGLVSRLLSKKCDAVFLNLKGSEKEFKRKDNIKIVGNPVRKVFIEAERENARRRLGVSKNDFLISSFGGSGGAKKINDTVAELMLSHSKKNKRIRHIHSCGKKYYSELKERYPTLFDTHDDRCKILPYVEDMPTVLAASDLVISRCGAMTLAEICAVGAAAILIPSPNVTGNHQYKNAKLVCDSGGAIMLTEEELSVASLTDKIKALENDSAKRAAMAKRIKDFCVEDSARLIKDEIMRIVKK